MQNNRKFEKEPSEFKERMVAINRVAKVVKGGKNFRFTALMVVGNENGKVGVGLGKAVEIPEAVRKGVEDAKRHMIEVPIVGTTERPRLNVYRSTVHIYAQVIDDSNGNTLASASTLDAEVKAQLEGKNKTEAAKLVGMAVGKRALEKGVKKVVFDRGGYLYTGRVAALAEGAREAGLDF